MVAELQWFESHAEPWGKGRPVFTWLYFENYSEEGKRNSLKGNETSITQAKEMDFQPNTEVSSTPFHLIF